jgi:hypothetical protein
MTCVEHQDATDVKYSQNHTLAADLRFGGGGRFLHKCKGYFHRKAVLSTGL